MIRAEFDKLTPGTVCWQTSRYAAHRMVVFDQFNVITKTTRGTYKNRYKGAKREVKVGTFHALGKPTVIFTFEPREVSDPIEGKTEAEVVAAEEAVKVAQRAERRDRELAVDALFEALLVNHVLDEGQVRSVRTTDYGTITVHLSTNEAMKLAEVLS